MNFEDGEGLKRIQNLENRIRGNSLNNNKLIQSFSIVENNKSAFSSINLETNEQLNDLSKLSENNSMNSLKRKKKINNSIDEPKGSKKVKTNSFNKSLLIFENDKNTKNEINLNNSDNSNENSNTNAFNNKKITDFFSSKTINNKKKINATNFIKKKN